MKSLALPTSKSEKEAGSNNDEELLREIQRPLPDPVAHPITWHPPKNAPSPGVGPHGETICNQYCRSSERREQRRQTSPATCIPRGFKAVLDICRVGLMQARKAGGDFSKKSGHHVMDVFHMDNTSADREIAEVRGHAHYLAFRRMPGQQEAQSILVDD